MNNPSFPGVVVGPFSSGAVFRAQNVRRDEGGRGGRRGKRIPNILFASQQRTAPRDRLARAVSERARAENSRSLEAGRDGDLFRDAPNLRKVVARALFQVFRALYLAPLFSQIRAEPAAERGHNCFFFLTFRAPIRFFWIFKISRTVYKLGLAK